MLFGCSNDLLAYGSTIAASSKYKLHQKIAIDKSFTIKEQDVESGKQSTKDGAGPEGGAAASSAGGGAINEYRYRLIIESSAKSFIVFCKDKAEQQSWFRDIQRCVQTFSHSVLATSTKGGPVTTAKLLQDDTARCPLCEGPYGTVFKRKNRMI